MKNLRKVSFSDRDLMKKRRVLTSYEVSYWREEFDGDGLAAWMAYGKEKEKPCYGESKREDKVSAAFRVNSLKGLVGG